MNLRAGYEAVPMFDTVPETGKKADAARSILQPLRPEFQDCALEQIRRPAELQNNL